MTGARALDTAARIDWLRLARTSRVGPITFAQLITRYRTAGAALDALPQLAARSGARAPKPPSREAARAELDAIETAGGVLLASCEPAFPALLAALDPPPPVITVLGAPHLLHGPAIAFVGARNASGIGLKLARSFAQGVGAAGYRVVSGLARGIDAASHEASLATGSIAVVAGGADVVYPPEHEDLQARLAAQGAIVSENPLGVRPTARDFPRRNRLVSGLSLGVLVIEAAERSGSLITARFAGEQGREVMAVPGSPLDPRARGANALLRDGAALIETVADILAVIEATRRRVSEPARSGYDTGDLDEAALLSAADEVRERVLELLTGAPIHRDELVRLTGAGVAAVSSALLELELSGAAIQSPGGFVTRNYDLD